MSADEVTTAEAGRMLGVTPAEVCYLIRRGRLVAREQERTPETIALNRKPRPRFILMRSEVMRLAIERADKRRRLARAEELVRDGEMSCPSIARVTQLDHSTPYKIKQRIQGESKMALFSYAASTLIRDAANAGDRIISVDTTHGFPPTGILQIGESQYQYAEIEGGHTFVLTNRLAETHPAGTHVVDVSPSDHGFDRGVFADVSK